MISQNSIQKVLDIANVHDVISDFVTLKKRGSNFLGLCPFHGEKTPSFTVSPTKNIYKCFGCGRGGGSVHFLMEHEKLSFPEAIRNLAKRYQIQLEETESSAEDKKLQSVKDSLYIITERAAKYYQNQLTQSPEGKNIGLSYFKSRGFLEKTIKSFGLGYASEKKDQFTAYAIGEGYNIELLRKAGLTTQYDRDFFRNRVMIPIFGLSGKVIGFGGRIMTSNPKEPKYINSPENEIYEKRRILYGLYQAKKEISKKDQCILVEGYTDVMSLHQFGVENVVASSGTSLTTDQVRLVGRYSKNILILFDGDKAGIKAAMRGIDLILEQDMNVKIALLPNDHDPDSFIRHTGATGFLEYLEQESLDFILFKAKQLEKETANDPVKKTEIIADIVQSISAIGNSLKRALYVKQCAEIFELSEEVIISTLNIKIRERLKKQHRDRQREERQQQRASSQKSRSQNNTKGEFSIQEFPSQESFHDEFEGSQYPSIEQGKNSISPVQTHSDFYQERDIIRVLIVHGHKMINMEEDTISVHKYVISKLDDLIIEGFEHALYANIIKEVTQLILEGKSIDEKYFTAHANEEIRQLAISMVSEPFYYSENWEKMYRIHLQMQKIPEENFEQDARQACLRFMIKKYKKMSLENKKMIQQAQTEGNSDDVNTCLTVQTTINKYIQELTTELGMVLI